MTSLQNKAIKQAVLVLQNSPYQNHVYYSDFWCIHVYINFILQQVHACTFCFVLILI